MSKKILEQLEECLKREENSKRLTLDIIRRKQQKINDQEVEIMNLRASKMNLLDQNEHAQTMLMQLMSQNNRLLNELNLLSEGQTKEVTGGEKRRKKRRKKRTKRRKKRTKRRKKRKYRVKSRK